MKKNQIKPLHDRVIIKPTPIKKQTSGGIIIPDTAAEKPIEGTVLYAGIAVKEIKVTDNVLYGKHAGQPITLNEGDCLIMREADVMAVI